MRKTYYCVMYPSSSLRCRTDFPWLLVNLQPTVSPFLVSWAPTSNQVLRWCNQYASQDGHQILCTGDKIFTWPHRLLCGRLPTPSSEAPSWLSYPHKVESLPSNCWKDLYWVPVICSYRKARKLFTYTSYSCHWYIQELIYTEESVAVIYLYSRIA